MKEALNLLASWRWIFAALVCVAAAGWAGGALYKKDGTLRFRFIRRRVAYRDALRTLGFVDGGTRVARVQPGDFVVYGDQRESRG